MSLYEPFAALLDEARTLEKASSRPDDVWLPSRNELVRVPVAAIKRVEAEGDYVRIFVEERSFLFRTTMARMEEQLGADRFLRVHRSTLVAKDHVSALRHTGGGAWSVVDRDGIESAVGRKYDATVRRALSVPTRSRKIT